MNLTELLEERKEEVRSRLAEARTAEDVQALVADTLEKLLYAGQEESESERVRETAAHLVKTAGAAASLVDTEGEPEIWEKHAGEASYRKKPKTKVRLIGVLLLVAGLALLGAACALFLTKVPEAGRQGNFELPLILLSGSAAALFAGGRLFRKRVEEPEAKKEQKVILHTDPAKVWRSLRAITVIMDRELALAEEEEKVDLRRLTDTEEGLSREELSLFAGLLEASRSRDPEYAMDQLGDVGFYLHKCGIETVEYSPERASWFELLPGEKPATLRPALVKDGELLYKGLASEGF